MKRRALVFPVPLIVVAIACGPEAHAPAASPPPPDVPATASSVDAGTSDAGRTTATAAMDAGISDAGKPPLPSSIACPKDLADTTAHPSCRDVAAAARAYGMRSYSCGSQLWSCRCPMDDADPQWACGPSCVATYESAKTTACDPANHTVCDYPEGQCRCIAGYPKFKCAAQCLPSFAATKAQDGKDCSENAVCNFPEGKCVCGQTRWCGGVQPDPNRPKVWTCYGPRDKGCTGLAP